MKRILFCTPAPLTKSLGAAKVVLELAEEMRLLGWDCSLLCPADIAPPDCLAPSKEFSTKKFSANLRAYLRRNAGCYDVVDYDHEHLPYARQEFDARPLLVARSVLLAQHLDQIFLPTGKSLRARAGSVLKSRARRQERGERVLRAQATVCEADLVNVSNHADKAELMRRGIREHQIAVLPYGISRTSRPLFEAVSSLPPFRPFVAFVGTFDYRKGAGEFPEIVSRVVAAVPGVQFKLLGTKGMFPGEAEVRAQFPSRVQKQLEIVPTYPPEELPQRLCNCSLGIFPSHMEGFGFGVLEMLAASLPVIAYDAPGPPMMLPPEYLVPRGNAEALAQKVVTLLQDDGRLRNARRWAKQRSQLFDWPSIAQMTSELYLQRLQERSPSPLQGSAG